MEDDMALVRRAAAVGRAQVPPAPGATPQQPGLVAPPPPGGQPPVAASTPGQEMAAAVPSLPAKAWAVVTGLGLAGVGALGAFNIQEVAAPNVFQIGDPMSTFGVLFVLAGAVGRGLEPFSRFMPGRAPQHRSG